MPRVDRTASPSASIQQTQTAEGDLNEKADDLQLGRGDDSWHSRGARGGARGRGLGRRGAARPAPPAGAKPEGATNTISTGAPTSKKFLNRNGKPPPTGPKKDRVAKAKTPKVPVVDVEATIPLDQRPLTPISNVSSSSVRVKLPGGSHPASVQLSTEDAPSAAPPKLASGSASGPKDDSKAPVGSKPSSTVVKLPSKTGSSSRPKVRVTGSLATAASAAAKSSAHVRSPLVAEAPLPSSLAPSSNDAPPQGFKQHSTKPAEESEVAEKDPFVVHVPPRDRRADIARQTFTAATPSHPPEPPQPLDPSTAFNPLTTTIPPPQATPAVYSYAPYTPLPPSFAQLPLGVAVGENGVLFEIASGRPVILTQPPHPHFQPSPIYQAPPRLSYPQQPFHPSRVHTPDSVSTISLSSMPANPGRPSLPANSSSYGHKALSATNEGVNGEVSLSMDIPGAAYVPIFVPAGPPTAPRSKAIEIRAPSAESSSSSNTAGGKSVGAMTNGTTVSTSGSVANSSLPTSPSNVFVPGSKMWTPGTLANGNSKGKAPSIPSNLRASILRDPGDHESDDPSTAKPLASINTQATSHDAFNVYYGHQGYAPPPNGYYPSPIDYTVYAPAPVGLDGQPQQPVTYGGGYFADSLQYGVPPTMGGAYYSGDPYGVAPNPYGTVYYNAPNPYAPSPDDATAQIGEDPTHGYY